MAGEIPDCGNAWSEGRAGVVSELHLVAYQGQELKCCVKRIGDAAVEARPRELWRRLVFIEMKCIRVSWGYRLDG